MGATSCRCHCDGTKVGAQDDLPSRKEYNSLRIFLEGAEFPKLESASTVRLYSTCEVRGSGKSCRTSIVEGGREVTWRHEHQFREIDRGDDLLLAIFDASDKDEAGRDKKVASTLMEVANIFEQGFHGSLQLMAEVEAFEDSRLNLRFVREYLTEGKMVVALHPGLQVEEAMHKVRVTFRVSEAVTDKEVTMEFTEAPLGMTFVSDVMPMVVRNDPTLGQAKELGVRHGWVITKVDDVDLVDMAYEAAFSIFKEKVKVLYKGMSMVNTGADSIAAGMPSVQLTFWPSLDFKDHDIVKTFTGAPLGMIFAHNQVPIVVRHQPASGQAKVLGVKRGWVIAKIDGVDITQMSYAEAFELLQSKVRALPCI